MSDFASHLDALAQRILEALQAPPRAHGAPTAWELKLELKASLAQIYLALGILLRDGRVRVVPEGLSYRVHLVSKSSPRPAADIVIHPPSRASEDALAAVPAAETASPKT